MPLNPAQLKEHVLNRVGYGQLVWNGARYDQLGAAGYIAEQLGDSLPAITIDHVTRYEKIRRGAYEQRQLEAVLRNFWFNHFNVYATHMLTNNLAGVSLWPFENLAIAPYVLGRFGDMLLEVAKSPAMIEFLDNRFSTLDRPNENYARELMELHTIGVNGGYTETDVKNVARIFTGWSASFERIGLDPWVADFQYRPEFHDTDSKIVLGEDFPAGGGVEEGEALLEFLAAHPSAGPFLAYKLCTHFVSEAPPAALVSQIASVFYDTDGDLLAVMSAILASPEFTDPAVFRTKVKAPHRWMSSALAAVGLDAASTSSHVIYDLGQATRKAGESPYMNPVPAGYPDVSGYWVSPVSMEQRFIAAGQVATSAAQVVGARAGVDGSDPVDTVDGCAAVMMPGGISDFTRTAVLDHMVLMPAMNNVTRIAIITQLLLCSPEFLRY